MIPRSLLFLACIIYSTLTAFPQVNLDDANGNYMVSVCDTLHFPLPGTPTIYTVGTDSGFVCGNNIYGDLAKADYFEPADTGKLLYKGFFDFGFITIGAGHNPNIFFHAWKNDGNGGFPGTVIATASVPLVQIYNNAVAQKVTEVVFNPPVHVNSPFYLGVYLPSATGDTIALISTAINEVATNTAFEMWSDSSWHAFSQAQNQGGWGMKLTQSIYAQYCDVGFGIGDNSESAEVRIYPNPANDFITIEMPSLRTGEKADIILYNFLGQTIKSHFTELSGEDIVLRVSDVSPGMYLMAIRSKDLNMVRKVMIR